MIRTLLFLLLLPGALLAQVPSITTSSIIRFREGDNTFDRPVSDLRTTVLTTIDSTMISNGGVSVLDIGQHGATTGQVLKWNGTQWAPGTATGDNWGSQVVEHSSALSGSGTSGSNLDIATGGVNSTHIANGTIADADLRSSGAFSVIGNAINVTNPPADISASAADQVLRVNNAGTALGFGTVATGGIADAAVTSAKIGGLTDTKVAYGNSSGGLSQSTNLAWDATNELLAIGNTGGSAGQRLRLYNFQSGTDNLNALNIAQRYTGSSSSKVHKAIDISQDHNASSATTNTFTNINSILQSNTTAATPASNGFYNLALTTTWNSTNSVSPAGGINSLVEGNHSSGTISLMGIQNTVRKLSGAGTISLIQGARFITSHSTTSGTVSEVRGFQVDAFNAAVNNGADLYVYSTQNKASGYVTALRGIRLSMYNNSSFSISAGYGTDFDFTTNANTAITTLYGHRIVSTNFLGTNQYGFYANLANNGAGSGTNWGVYVTASDRNYFNKNVLIGTTGTPAAYLHVKGSGTTSGSFSEIVRNNADSCIISMRDDRRVGIGKEAAAEALDVNGQARVDALDIRNWTGSSNTSSGQLQYHDGSSGTYSAYMTIGAGERRFPIMPTVIPLQAVDYNVDWTTGRTKAFWTVPARYSGWKVSKVYLMVSTIGSTTGNTIEVEKGGTALATQTITTSDHTINLDENISTGDIFTFDITGTGATATKGLYVEIELRYQ